MTAPNLLGGYRVLEATVSPAPHSPRGHDGKPACSAGWARIEREDGLQAVLAYDQEANEVQGIQRPVPRFARGICQTSVDRVARWVSASTARRQYRAVTEP